jgi:hypothetical protein
MNISTLPTNLAWEFTHLMPGTFRRNKADFAHHEYPIIAPLPSNASKTEPHERTTHAGPFLYFVVDEHLNVCYVGKSAERNVLKRWIRPGNGGPAGHYWTHSTKSGGCVFNMAEGLRRGCRYQLRYAALRELQDHGLVDSELTLEDAERHIIAKLSPPWNLA